MIIDFHTHLLGGKQFNIGVRAGERAIEVMDRYGLDKAVLFTVDGFWGDYREDNTYLAKQSAEFPDRLFPFATVNPRDGQQAVDELRRCLGEWGMRGIKFHPWLQGFSPLESYMDDIARVAVEYRVPILFHDGTPPYTSPLQIAALAGRFPELQVVLGHAGLMDMWMEAVAAARRLNNIWLCFSGGTPFRIYERMLREVDVSRVMYGSDVFGDDTIIEMQLTKIRSLPVGEEALAAILGGNARRLLRL